MATATLNEIKIGQSFQTEFFTFGTMVSVVRVAYLTNHLEPISLDYKGEPIIIGNLKPEFELTISWD